MRTSVKYCFPHTRKKKHFRRKLMKNSPVECLDKLALVLSWNAFYPPKWQVLSPFGQRWIYLLHWKSMFILIGCFLVLCCLLLFQFYYCWYGDTISIVLLRGYLHHEILSLGIMFMLPYCCNRSLEAARTQKSSGQDGWDCDCPSKACDNHVALWLLWIPLDKDIFFS